MRFQVNDLSNGYTKEDVFSNISFYVEPGEILFLLGPNGVGKTTLFKTLLGTLKPRRGHIYFDQDNITLWGRKKTARHIGYVPQHHNPYFPFTVFDVVLMGRTPYLSNFAVPSMVDRSIAKKALESLGIDHLAKKHYTGISGGERQLVLIARALAQEPKLLIMDEPTANLDFGNQVKILKLLKTLARQDKAIIVSTHVPDHALRYATKVALMRGGNSFVFGPPHELMDEEILEDIYGVDIRVIETWDGGDAPIKICVPS